MLKSLLASALFAGLIAGLFAAGLQQAFLVPLITEAELYETGAVIHFGTQIDGAEAARFLRWVAEALEQQTLEGAA